MFKKIAGIASLSSNADPFSNERTKLLDQKLKTLFVPLNSGGDKIMEEKIPMYIILPTSEKKVIFDMLVCLVIICNTVFIPLDIGFNKECFINDKGLEVLMIWNIITYVLYGLDLLLTFITALKNKKGENEYELKKIAIEYFKSYFVIDAGAVLPLEYIIVFDPSSCWQPSIALSKVFLIFRFLKIVGLNKIIDLVEKVVSAKYVSVIRLFKIVIFYFFIIHVIGILFTSNSPGLLKQIPDEIKQGKSWDAFYNLYSMSIYVGIFFVLGNDLIFESNGEKMMIILINVVSLIVNANIFGYIAVTLKNSDVGGDVNLERIESIKDFANYQGIDTKLKNQITKFYEQMYKRQRSLYFGKDIFEDLSDSLKTYFKYYYWKKIYFFYDKVFVQFSPEFLKDSLLAMKAKMMLEKERVINEGESSTDFYMLPGGAKCAVTLHGITIKTLTEGGYFGETAIFLNSEKRTATVKCLNQTDIIYIPGNDFLTILRNHPEASDYLRKVAESNFFKTIKMTRLNLITLLFDQNGNMPFFKNNLYEKDEFIVPMDPTLGDKEYLIY
jgi:CRP-like cAMP-binding protein